MSDQRVYLSEVGALFVIAMALTMNRFQNPLTKKDIYLHEQADTEVEAEKARTKLLHQVDEKRHPKTQVTMSFLLDRWLGVAELDETSYERAEGIIRNYLKPTFGDLKAGKLTAEMLELFYARLRQCQEQCEGRRNGKTDPKTKQKHVCEPLAANSVRKIHFILRPALNRGLRWGYVTTNVAALAEPPSQPKPNPDPPTPEEAALVRLVPRAPGHRLPEAVQVPDAHADPGGGLAVQGAQASGEAALDASGQQALLLTAERLTDLAAGYPAAGRVGAQLELAVRQAGGARVGRARRARLHIGLQRPPVLADARRERRHARLFGAG